MAFAGRASTQTRFKWVFLAVLRVRVALPGRRNKRDIG